MGLTGMILTGAFVALGIYDIVAAFRGGVNSTISRTMQTAGFRSPTVLFVLGGLFGHCFLQLDLNGVKTDMDVLFVVVVVAVSCTACGWIAGRRSREP